MAGCCRFNIVRPGPRKIVVFAAHWRPVCQREIPKVVQWVADGALPFGVEAPAVPSAESRERGNWPADKWFSGRKVAARAVGELAIATLGMLAAAVRP